MNKKYTTVSELLKAAAGAGGKKGGDKDKRAKSDETKFSGSFTVGEKEVIFRDEYGLRPLVRSPYKKPTIRRDYKKTGENEGESSRRRYTTSLLGRKYNFKPEAFHSFRQSEHRRGVLITEDTGKQWWKVVDCKRWTDVEWLILLRMKFNKYSTEEMMVTLNRSSGSVSQKFNNMKRKGWVIDPDELDRTKARWTDEEFAIACRMKYIMKMSYKEIGILLGRSKSSVYQHFYNLSR